MAGYFEWRFHLGPLHIPSDVLSQLINIQQESVLVVDVGWAICWVLEQELLIQELASSCCVLIAPFLCDKLKDGHNRINLLQAYVCCVVRFNSKKRPHLTHFPSRKHSYIYGIISWIWKPCHDGTINHKVRARLPRNIEWPTQPMLLSIVVSKLQP